jgi:hypothetical protein
LMALIKTVMKMSSSTCVCNHASRSRIAVIEHSGMKYTSGTALAVAMLIKGVQELRTGVI